MIERFQLLRNVGQFDNVSVGPQLSLTRMALIYGENGRGKTTLAAILRSLATGEPTSIIERKRLGAGHDPHIVVEANGQAYMFQNGAWSATLGADGESWVNEGMGKIDAASDGRESRICPFCAQDLNNSPLIRDYEAYFSEAYAELRTAISNQVQAIETAHGGQVPAALMRVLTAFSTGDYDRCEFSSQSASASWHAR